jgi:hypothetical protein
VKLASEIAERAETWLYTGPVGRVLAFAGDFASAWIRWARGLDPSARPERHKRSGDRAGD